MKRLKRLSAIFLSVTLLIATTACKTTTTINSDPPGADVYINGIHYGKTPTTIQVTNTTFGDYRITLKKEGYKTYEAILPKELKVGPLLVGLLCFWPTLLIWLMGPPPMNNFKLEPVEGGGNNSGSDVQFINKNDTITNGYFTVLDLPEGASVEINGMTIETTGAKVQLRPGNYEVKINYDGKTYSIGKVEIYPGMLRAITVRL